MSVVGLLFYESVKSGSESIVESSWMIWRNRIVIYYVQVMTYWAVFVLAGLAIRYLLRWLMS